MIEVRMQDVAVRAGVHRTTVSMALRNHPKLSQATRKRIQKIAQDMGYTANPMVSALMQYRAARRTPKAKGEIGFLTNEDSEHAWKGSQAYQRIYSGACQRANEMGFDLVPIWLRQPGMSAKCLNKIFYHRNIHAAIVSPQLSHLTKLDWINWSRISAVAVGYSLQFPLLHRVAHDYFHAVTTTVQNTLLSGYKRLGLILDGSADLRAGHLWLGSWHVLRDQHPELLPPLIVSEVAPKSSDIANYIRKYRPDAVCVLPSTKFETLISWSTRLPCPRRISLGCYDKNSSVAGIYQNYERIGRVAVDQVSAVLFRSERGIPTQSTDTLVRGIWVGFGEEIEIVRAEKRTIEK